MGETLHRWCGRHAAANRTIAFPTAIGETQLRLKAVTTRWNGERHGTVSHPGVEIRGKSFSDAMKRTTSLRRSNHIAGRLPHRCLPGSNDDLYGPPY